MLLFIDCITYTFQLEVDSHLKDSIRFHFVGVFSKGTKMAYLIKVDISHLRSAGSPFSTLELSANCMRFQLTLHCGGYFEIISVASIYLEYVCVFSQSGATNLKFNLILLL